MFNPDVINVNVWIQVQVHRFYNYALPLIQGGLIPYVVVWIIQWLDQHVEISEWLAVTIAQSIHKKYLSSEASIKRYGVPDMQID